MVFIWHIVITISANNKLLLRPTLKFHRKPQFRVQVQGQFHNVRFLAWFIEIWFLKKCRQAWFPLLCLSLSSPPGQILHGLPLWKSIPCISVVFNLGYFQDVVSQQIALCMTASARMLEFGLSMWKCLFLGSHHCLGTTDVIKTCLVRRHWLPFSVSVGWTLPLPP